MFITVVFRTDKNGQCNNERGEKAHARPGVLCVQHSASFHGKCFYAQKKLEGHSTKC